MAFLDEIAVRLVAQGVGVLNTNIFIGNKALIPTGAGPYLQLKETGGTDSAKTQNDTGTERPSAQLNARAASYQAARAMLHAAYNALGGVNGVYNVTLSGTKYLKITARQSITDIGSDADARPMVAFNIDAEKAPS